LSFLPLVMMCVSLRFEALAASMEHPVANFHADLTYRNAKHPASQDAGLLTIVEWTISRGCASGS
jgi:hypothetical protein